MEEKYTALELLGEYASTLPADFAQFAPKVLKAILPIINQPGYSLVRQNAATVCDVHLFGGYRELIRAN